MEKVLKRKCFADVEQVKQKTAEALKGIKIDEFKSCFDERRRWRPSRWKLSTLALVLNLDSWLIF